MKKRICLCCISGLFLLLNCHSKNPTSSGGNNTPITRGIVHTDETGPIPLEVWGSPADSLNGKDMDLYYPFPNPFNGSCSFMFGLYKSMRIKMWIVSAKLQSKTLFKSLTQDTLKILMDGMLAAGMHQVMWDCKTDESAEVPNGFYRIYLQSVGELLWTDGLALDPSKPIPADVKAFLKSVGYEIE